jgi:hypothetical protein
MFATEAKAGATTLNIMTFNIMTLSIIAERCYAVCHLY